MERRNFLLVRWHYDPTKHWLPFLPLWIKWWTSKVWKTFRRLKKFLSFVSLNLGNVFKMNEQYIYRVSVKWRNLLLLESVSYYWITPIFSFVGFCPISSGCGVLNFGTLDMPGNGWCTQKSLHSYLYQLF